MHNLSLFHLGSLAFGLVLGSFYNVCIHRYLTGQSVVLPASHCPRCRTALSWWENIPVLSFILLRGRCRSCRQPISWRYPIVETVSGIWALLLAMQFGLGWEWLLYLVVGGLLIIMSFIDFQKFILPDEFTLSGAIVAFAGTAMLTGMPWVGSLLGAVLGAGFFWVLQKGYYLLRGVEGLVTGDTYLLLMLGALVGTALLTGMPWIDSLLGAVLGAGFFWVLQKGYYLLRGVEGLGTGDIKLMLMLGALVGWQGLPMMIFLAAFTALAASLAYMAKNAHQGMRTRIPFGPFLSLGAMLQILYGSVLINYFFLLA